MRALLATLLAAAALGCRATPAPAPERLAPEVAPLPHELVPEMLERIPRDATVDRDLVYRSLVGPQTTLRAYAAQFLGRHGDEAALPYLIDALRDESGHVGANYPEAGMAFTRYWANDSLVKLAKRDLGFAWNDPVERREQAVERWRAWYLDPDRAR